MQSKYTQTPERNSTISRYLISYRLIMGGIINNIRKIWKSVNALGEIPALQPLKLGLTNKRVMFLEQLVVQLNQVREHFEQQCHY